MKTIKYYKVKPEYMERARKISGTSGIFLEGTLTYHELMDAKVLDIWCEPVYEREKVEIDGYLNVYQGGARGINLYPSKEDADKHVMFGRIACIHIKGSFENLLE